MVQSRNDVGILVTLEERSSMSRISRSGAAIRLALSTLILAAALCIVPQVGYADVRDSDVIAGTTVQERGLAAADCPNIVAERAYVVDDSGKVYFERNADDQAHIASITKIMTALVALEYGDPQNSQVTISQTAAAIGESSAGLQAGDTMNLETALKALMLASGNDAAQGIAESLGGTVKQKLQDEGVDGVPDNDYDAFIFAMNKKASELGMNDSLFANPHGLDFNQYQADMHSSAHDVSFMAAEAMKNDLFRSIVGTDKTTIQVTRGGQQTSVNLQSTDILLGTYDGAAGVKTGYTEAAGECFAGAVTRDGKTLYAIVLGSSSEQQRFNDATMLDDWVYKNDVSYSLAHSTEETSYTDTDGQSHTVPVIAYVPHSGWIDKTFKATLADPQATVDVFALDGNVSQEVTYDTVSGNVSPGQKVGTVTFYQHNEVVATQDLVAAESCDAPGLIEGIGIWWDRLFRGFGNQQTVAKGTVVNTTPLIYGPNATLTNDTD